MSNSASDKIPRHSLSESCVSSSDPDRIPESLIDGNDSRDEDHDNRDQDLYERNYDGLGISE